jgi:hypothetical protein
MYLLVQDIVLTLLFELDVDPSKRSIADRKGAEEE